MNKKNTGDCNTGNYNTGNYNTGDYNTGNYNTGNYNTGNCNAGSCNTGNYNTGSRNTGNYNTGNYNTGYRNAGDYNTGNYNAGSRNTGNYNTGDYNTGFFCEETPNLILFDKDTGQKFGDIKIPHLYLPLTEWIPTPELSSDMLRKYPKAKTLGGVLIKRTYHEAWAVAWSKASDKLKQQFKDLPNFCPEKFQRITGIDVRNEGKLKVEANGKVVYISKDSAEALGLI